MPAFQALGAKRKLDHEEESSRKRPAFDAASSHKGEVRNHQTKKHKTWDGDAILVANSSKATLYDIDGKVLSVGKVTWPLEEGKELHVGGKDIELDRPITRNEYLSGQAFGSFSTGSEPVPAALFKDKPKQFIPHKIHATSVPKPNHSTNQSPKPFVPLQPVDPISVHDNVPKIKIENHAHWTANWRKPQQKKHQTWDGDAYVTLRNDKLVMISEEGKPMGSMPWKGDPLCSGYRTMINGKEVELDSQVEPSQLPDIIGAPEASNNDKSTVEDDHNGNDQPSEKLYEQISKFVSPTSFYAAPIAKKPKGPLHDPDAEDAIVMKAPTKEHIKKFNKKQGSAHSFCRDRPNLIASNAASSKRRILSFVPQTPKAADRGLGKTFQTIALVWTLLRQNPYASSTPVVQKVLIVCPVSLVNNWKAEFHKWLGRDRIGVVTCDKDKKNALLFMNARNQHVLVIGYERLRTVMNNTRPPIGLIICDEGHRLKSANNKTTQMFKALRTPRRIILSGTPIQNDLGEFHAMADFCNPGLLDEYSTFKRVYENPILKSRAPDASSKDIELGEARTAQLLTVARSFVLRRDATILKNILPPKHEYVVFVTPTALQLSIFSKILHPDKLDDLVQGSTAESLALINVLTKVSNSPILLKATADKAKENAKDTLRRTGVEDALRLIPEHAEIDDVSLSGKLSALAKLLAFIRSDTEEKCVLVSHYTSTLNILESFCRKKKYSYFRLDGQTPAAKRQEFVNTFNKSSRNQSFIFLLSSKAGGVGINLIGASRLCLIDSDWNPSHDLQSMARCHRDGQKRPVYIYRFLTTGAIDEKIYQRQVTKLGLSDSLMQSGTTSSKSDSFTRKELRDIFRIDPNTACNTHDLLECPCEHTRFYEDSPVQSTVEDVEEEEIEQGFVKACDIKPELIDRMDRAYLQKKKAELAALGEWKHINCLRSSTRDEVQDDVLRKLIDFHETMSKDSSSRENSRIEKLLSSIDLHNITALDKCLKTQEVPGGTISFIFQKSSISAVGPEGDVAVS
ncbi:hypothetical protein H0H92_008527 [Tricholoma furcatifolium]|nr:hypothetical protein H0H92_008527 [Tricholoma furcatifolium]